jgi:hypothetical protein
MICGTIVLALVVRPPRPLDTSSPFPHVTASPRAPPRPPWPGSFRPEIRHVFAAWRSSSGVALVPSTSSCAVVSCMAPPSLASRRLCLARVVSPWSLSGVVLTPPPPALVALADRASPLPPPSPSLLGVPAAASQRRACTHAFSLCPVPLASMPFPGVFAPPLLPLHPLWPGLSFCPACMRFASPPLLFWPVGVSGALRCRHGRG